VPHERGALLFCGARDEVALVHPDAVLADVALEEDRHPVRGDPAEDPPGCADEPGAPGLEVEPGQLRDVGQGGDDAAPRLGGVRVEPGEGFGLEDASRGWLGREQRAAV